MVGIKRMFRLVNPSSRKGNDRRGGAREGAVPGAGVGPGSGGNRVRFQEMLEKDGVPADKSGVGVEAPSAAQVGQGKTQREMIFEAVEALRSLLGQGVCSQVEDLIQEHIPPHPKVTPIPRLNQSVLNILPCCLKIKPNLRRVFKGREEKVSKARLAVSRAEDDLSILQLEMRGLSFQIDAHHREDDARREKNQGRGDDMEGVFVEEADSGEEAGVQADGSKRRRVGKGRFGGGSSSSRVNPDYLVELLRGMSEEDQATFRRNYGSYGGDDVSSLDGDKTQAGVRGQDLTETSCLSSFQVG